MKFLSCTLLFFISISSLAGKSLLTYSIKSDTLNPKLKAGQCLVYGKVLEGATPISDALISTVNHKTQTKSKKDGTFSFIINNTDTSLYLFKPNYNEIIIYSYKFKNKHAVEIDFYPTENRYIDELEKPVIYLYNNTSIKAFLKLNTKGNITFTYPKYKNKWDITVLPNGNLSCGDKTYPYLFWEGEKEGLTFIKQENKIKGFLIKTDTCISFLENTLTKLGLNDKESNDFITYWGPRMEQKEYALLQFLVDDEYDSEIAEIKVTPALDSKRRVFMTFTQLNTLEETKKAKVSPQNLPVFNRHGFTLIEWGGAQVNLNKQSL